MVVGIWGQALSKHGELKGRNASAVKRDDMGRDTYWNEGLTWNYFTQCFKTSLPLFKSMSLSVYPGPWGWQSSFKRLSLLSDSPPSTSH